jgi:aminoglycoside phosphotransferase (APT) family kinase protein
MAVSEAALSPSEVVGLVETWPCLHEMGLSIAGCKVKEVRPTEDGGMGVDYRFKLAVAGIEETLKTTVHGTFYRDDGGERKYTELLERLRGKEERSADGGVRGFTLADADESVPGFAIYVPEHRLLLESSLADEELAGLGMALDPDAMTPLLARCLAAYRPGEEIRVCEVEILRYKRAKRCTLRYRLLSETGPGSIIGKIYGDAEKAERIAAAMAELARQGFGRDAIDGIKTPQPYGYVGELQMVLMEDVPGVPMSDRLGSPEVAEHLKMAARTLVKLHRCPVAVPMTYDVEDRISHLERGVAKVVQVCPDLAELFESSLSRLGALARELDCPAPALVHGSLYPGEFFLGDGDVTIVDFDTICHGDPAVDVGNFLGHLKRKALQLGWTEEEARCYAETFLAAYEAECAVRGALSTGRLAAGRERWCAVEQDPLSPRTAHCAPRTAFYRRIDYYRRAVLLKIACRVALRPAYRHLAVGLLNEGR